MKNAGKSVKSSPRSGGQEARKDRKSGTGTSGSPKKGGHGGKYTWAGVGYSHAELGFDGGAVDARDPNFEDLDQEIVEA
ncbi:Protein PAT1 2 like [Actinidia chinensis var. chinensis]|uniref:Programmed cell death protein 4-like n=2 Tax=Actinidia TaxID=3624 RepID=A0A7J0DGJ8_9ERIC|nr:Protein PAT1 2 like [Actinidia chinensis var. chinensis]GFS33636.1 hypothetical protein Acr_00g0029750 [Actinidia rufa]